MSTALSYSKYYLEQEEVKLYNASAASKKLSKLVYEYNQEENIEDKELKNQNIYQLKVNLFEQRIALLEGGTEALAVKSFSEARRLVLKNLAGPGDNIITINSASLLFDKAITKEENIEVRNAYNSNLSAFLDGHSKAIYLETIASDDSIPDFLKISAFAKSAGIPLIVDNTQGVAGYVSTPLKNGADIIITDTSELFKTSTGVIGAVIVDGGNFNWKSDKFSQLAYAQLDSSDSQRFSFLNFLRNQYSIDLEGSIITSGISQLINEIDSLPVY